MAAIPYVSSVLVSSPWVLWLDTIMWLLVPLTPDVLLWACVSFLLTLWCLEGWSWKGTGSVLSHPLDLHLEKLSPIVRSISRTILPWEGSVCTQKCVFLCARWLYQEEPSLYSLPILPKKMTFEIGRACGLCKKSPAC